MRYIYSWCDYSRTRVAQADKPPYLWFDSITITATDSRELHISKLLSLSQKLIRKAVSMPALSGLKAKVRALLYDAAAAQRIEDKIRPLHLEIDNSAPARINFLIPEINFRTFFGGYIAKFHLARKLDDSGFKVRFVLVDPCVVDETAWRDMVAQYQGLEDIFNRVEVVACGDRSEALTVSPSDRIIATTWWTSHIAQAMSKALGREKFLYLIQEYEPFTFPMGSYYALADQSYTFAHRALFSSPQLRDYFQQRQIGLYGEPWGDPEEGEAFENAILSYTPDQLHKNRSPGEYKLLFYARPEPHAARNMFEIAFLALARAIEQGHFNDAKWEFHGIGSQSGDMDLPGGRRLKMLGKFGLAEYKQRLTEYDLGLSLMYTPHPSLLPLEMAAAGMRVVSNECENKTAAELGAISANLLAAPPTIDGVCETLGQAAANCGDLEARREGASVNWAACWDKSFDKPLMARILEWLN